MTDNRTTELVSRREATTLLEEFLCGYQDILLSRGINASEAVCKQNELIDEYAERIEHVIATTLGRGTGEWVLEHSGTLYDKWRCSQCGYLFVESRCDQGYTDLEPNFCPKCGVDFREVVGE